MSVKDCLKSKAVRLHTESAYHTKAGTRYHRLMSELLALVNVADVYLDNGRLKRAYAILQRYAGMCISPGIEDYAVVAEAHLLHLVDKTALDVALIIVYLHVVLR